MDVNGVGHGIIGRLVPRSDRFAPRSATSADPSARSDEAKQAVSSAAEPVEEELGSDAGTGGTGQKGVLRLLEEGHFKGVADVRLRINFHEELSARAAAAAGQIVSVASGELIDAVTAKAQEIVGSWGLDDDAQKAASDLVTQFEVAAQAARGELAGETPPDTAGLVDALRAAFESFLEQLGAMAPLPANTVDPAAGDVGSLIVVAPEQVEPSSETDGATSSPTDGVAAPPVDTLAGDDAPLATDVAGTDNADGASAPEPTATAPDPQAPTVSNADIEALRQLFADALAELLASSDQALQLPPLASQPSGNGKAYSKFVEIYHGLAGQVSPPEPAAVPAGDHVDVAG